MKTLDMSTTGGVAQGEVLLIPVSQIPSKAEPVEPVDGQHVIAHSETGHHHRMLGRGVHAFRMPDDELTQYLKVDVDTTLDHLRENDRHESYRIRPGSYMVRKARESIIGAARDETARQYRMHTD